jgi:hypothetical protein
MLVGFLPAASAAAQQPGERCFPETGYCISGPIRQYWEQNGGLPVFGYPTTPQRIETIEDWSGPVQWFERDRLEDHSNQGIGVLAGRLGVERLEQMGRPWSPRTPAPVEPGCRLFPETGYQACGAFLNYWNRNGGLMRFGYPVTDVMVETIEGRQLNVQYFERRRMEWHPQNPAPYNVLLGLLGNEIRSGLPPAEQCQVAVLQELRANYEEFNRQQPLGCPLPGEDYSYTEAATARFERGQMYWVNQRGGRSLIHVIYYNADGTLSHQVFNDTWQEGEDPVDTGLEPPEGLYEPRRGFGKVWREQPGVADRIGWALEHERAVRASYQIFERGRLMRVMSESVVWRFSNDGSARNAPVRY